MKKIVNWRKGTVADIEADNLLDDITKIHVLSYQMESGKRGSLVGSDHKKLETFLQWHIDNQIPLIGHNFIMYDVPAIEKVLGKDFKDLMVIDTLLLSWYLNHERKQHGLEKYGEDYGVPKPEISDWKNLTYEEYRHRCEEDVKINTLLWKDLLRGIEELFNISKAKIESGEVGGKRMSEDEVIYLDQFRNETLDEYITRFLEYIMFKGDCIALAEKTCFEVDVRLLEKSIKDMELEQERLKTELESVMPPVPKYVIKKAPKLPYKKDGTLSAAGQSWYNLLEKCKLKEKDNNGNFTAVWNEDGETLKVLTKYEPANANSSDQIKSLLFSHWWVPQTFKFDRDEGEFQKWIDSKPPEGSPRGAWTKWKNSKPEDRKIPQITVQGDDGRELCESVQELAEEIPEINVYAKFNVAKHRLSVLKGFQKSLYKGKYLRARVAGLTNTLRMKHAELVNLVGVDKPYGEVIRGVLIAGKGKKLIGSDMSSLEDRTKHHFMLPYDPEYVETMQADDFDPHLLTALSSGFIIQEEFDAYKSGDKRPNVVAARKVGKSTNYASVYNAGPPTIARTAGVSLEQAQELHSGYWKLNWAVKAIAEDQVVVVDSKGGSWLVNPVNGFPYSLRKESDRFSTLCQGTGAYFFDMWLDNCLELQKEKWGKTTLTGQWHDEHVFCVRDREEVKMAFGCLIKEAIRKVNESFKLRRKLDCETQYGDRYSEIH